MVIRKLQGMCPSGLNRHCGLGSRCRLRKAGITQINHYTLDNSNNLNANPLHMNAHSFGNNCNQYIYLCSVCRCDLCWNRPSFCWKFIRPSLCVPGVFGQNGYFRVTFRNVLIEQMFRHLSVLVSQWYIIQLQTSNQYRRFALILSKLIVSEF